MSALCPGGGGFLEICRVQGFRAGVRLESNPCFLIGQQVLVVPRCPRRLHLHCSAEFSYSFLSQKADSSPRQVFLLTFLGMGSFILLIISLLRSSKKNFFFQVSLALRVETGLRPPTQHHLLVQLGGPSELPWKSRQR